MTATPVILAFVATIATGILVGILFLTRARKPRLTRLHLILSLAGLAMLVATAVAAPAAGGPPVLLPVGLIALAVAAGWSAKRFARASRRVGELVLVAHLFVGLAGFFVILAWAKALREAF